MLYLHHATDRISRFCFGCEPLGETDWGDDVDIETIATAIHHAVEQGVNFFDTADVYGLGLSEQRLSTILAEKRHDMIIATKGGVAWEKNPTGRASTRVDTSPSYIRHAVEQSLRRLNIDRIPLYYLHWLEKNQNIAPTAQTLYELQQAGKIAKLGCANLSSQQIREFLQHAPLDFIQLPSNILFVQPDDDIINLCADNKINMVAYNVLAAGLLTGKFTVQTTFSPRDRRARTPHLQGTELQQSIQFVENIRQQADAARLTLAQYAIQQTLYKPYVHATIIGIKTLAQLNENLIPFTTFTTDA